MEDLQPMGETQPTGEMRPTEEMRPPEQKHSGLGVASFVISVITAVLAFLLIVGAGVLEVTTPGGVDEESAVAIVVGLLIIGCMVIDLVALGLGIAGLVQRDRKKVFAVLGTVFSAATILGIIFVIMLGMMAG